MIRRVLVAGSSVALLAFHAPCALAQGATFTPPAGYAAGGGTELPVADQLIYRGTYSCAQGPTAVEIDLTGVGEGYGGLFRFGGGRVPRGSYTVDVEPLGRGAFRLRPLRWEQQPRGFTMVGAEVMIGNGRLAGRIDGPACGAIVADAAMATARAPAASAALSGAPARPAVGTPERAPAPAATALDTILDRVVAADSRTWGGNRYIAGSMTGARYLSGNKDKTTYVAEGKYRYTALFGGHSTGWVRIKVVNRSLDCLEFHDQAGVCRKPGASLSMQALGGMLAAGATSGGGSGERTCNPNDLVMVGNEFQPARACD